MKKQKIENFQDVTSEETLSLRDYPRSVSDLPNAVIARFPSQQGQAKQSSSSTQYSIPQTSNPVFSEDVTSDQTPQAIPEINFSLLTPVVYFYTWDHLGTVRLITNSTCAIVSKHNFEPYGVELPLYNETANNTHKFTGQERDASTGYDYMHFRFYASSIGRFLKPDNIIPDITNPQNWNAYTYVKGNPVNFNDPSGHTENQPLQQENKQNQPVGPTQPSTQNIEAMKTQEQKMVDQPKKIELTVYLIDKAGLTSEQTALLKNEVSKNYNQAGIEVSWVNLSSEAKKTVTVWRAKEDYLNNSKDQIEEKVFSVPSVLGYVSKSNSNVANVFFKESASFTNLTTSESLLGIVLGKIASHELGHTLGIIKYDNSTFNLMMSGHTSAAYKNPKLNREFLFTAKHSDRIQKSLMDPDDR